MDILFHKFLFVEFKRKFIRIISNTAFFSWLASLVRSLVLVGRSLDPRVLALYLFLRVVHPRLLSYYLVGGRTRAGISFLLHGTPLAAIHAYKHRGFIWAFYSGGGLGSRVDQPRRTGGRAATAASLPTLFFLCFLFLCALLFLCVPYIFSSVSFLFYVKKIFPG